MPDRLITASHDQAGVDGASIRARTRPSARLPRFQIPRAIARRFRSLEGVGHLGFSPFLDRCGGQSITSTTRPFVTSSENSVSVVGSRGQDLPVVQHPLRAWRCPMSARPSGERRSRGAELPDLSGLLTRSSRRSLPWRSKTNSNRMLRRSLRIRSADIPLSNGSHQAVDPHPCKSRQGGFESSRLHLHRSLRRVWSRPCIVLRSAGLRFRLDLFSRKICKLDATANLAAVLRLSRAKSTARTSARDLAPVRRKSDRRFPYDVKTCGGTGVAQSVNDRRGGGRGLLESRTEFTARRARSHAQFVERFVPSALRFITVITRFFLAHMEHNIQTVERNRGAIRRSSFVSFSGDLGQTGEEATLVPTWRLRTLSKLEAVPVQSGASGGRSSIARPSGECSIWAAPESGKLVKYSGSVTGAFHPSARPTA